MSKTSRYLLIVSLTFMAFGIFFLAGGKIFGMNAIMWCEGGCKNTGYSMVDNSEFAVRILLGASLFIVGLIMSIATFFKPEAAGVMEIAQNVIQTKGIWTIFVAVFTAVFTLITTTGVLNLPKLAEFEKTNKILKEQNKGLMAIISGDGTLGDQPFDFLQLAIECGNELPLIVPFFDTQSKYEKVAKLGNLKSESESDINPTNLYLSTKTRFRLSLDGNNNVGILKLTKELNDDKNSIKLIFKPDDKFSFKDSCELSKFLNNNAEYTNTPRNLFYCDDIQEGINKETIMRLGYCMPGENDTVVVKD